MQSVKHSMTLGTIWQGHPRSLIMRLPVEKWFPKYILIELWQAMMSIEKLEYTSTNYRTFLIVKFRTIQNKCNATRFRPPAPPPIHLVHTYGGCRSPAVACWASDHWVANSNQLRGKFRHSFRLIIPGVCLAQFSLNNVHKRGLRHHHFISSTHTPHVVLITYHINLPTNYRMTSIQGMHAIASVSTIPVNIHHDRWYCIMQSTLLRLSVNSHLVQHERVTIFMYEQLMSWVWLLVIMLIVKPT